MTNPKTIEIFLPDGNPKNIRIANITSRTIEVTYFSRSKFEFMKTRKNLKNVGVYFLIGYSEEDNKQIVYIGEAEDCFKRLSLHNKRTDFWNSAVVVTSKTRFFTKAHIKFLERFFYDKIKKAGRCTIQNNSVPTKSYISESMQATLMDNFETIKLLISTLGFSFFDRIDKAQAKKEKELIFECKDTIGHFGQGKYSEDGFVIFKGAYCKINLSKSLKEKGSVLVRQKLINNKILKEKSGKYILQEDFIFSSPSTAAQIILGRAANGWILWKLKDGKTLDDVYRKE